MMYVVVLSLCLLHSSVHASPLQTLSNIMENEQIIVSRLIDMKKTYREHIKQVDSYINDYKRMVNSKKGVVSLVSHPISGFKILQRLVRGWKTMEKNVKTMMKLMSTSHGHLENYRENIGFPTKDDLDITSKSLVVTQDTYDLSIEAFTKGTIRDRKTKKVYKTPLRLSAWDCYNMGVAAQKLNWLGSAMSWYKEAIKTIDHGDKTIRKQLLQTTLATITEKHDKIVRSSNPIGDKLRPDEKTDDPELTKNAKYKDNVKTKSGPKLFAETEKREEWKRLCRGGNMKPANGTKGVRCKLVTGAHPYFYLRPLKLEELSLHPYIGILHEFMSDMETIMLKHTEKTELWTLPYFSDYKRKQVGKIETSHKDDMLTSLSKRIEKVLGIEGVHEMESKQFQIINYGVGEPYLHGSHPVHLGKIATFMLYLSDVRAGGATVFPKHGISVKPKRRSAMFWSNLNQRGEVNLDTRHVGCPVLQGSMWVAYKLFGKGARAHNAKCGVNYFDKLNSKLWNAQAR